jgi:hypothetical protein
MVHLAFAAGADLGAAGFAVSGAWPKTLEVKGAANIAATIDMDAKNRCFMESPVQTARRPRP